MWVRFTQDFDYSPRFGVTIAFRAGMTEFVRAECAEQAVAAGKAEPVENAGPGPSIAETIAKVGRGRKR